MRKFIKQLKENWIAAMVVLIVTTSITQCNNVVDYFDEGTELLEKKKYNDKFNASLYERFNNVLFLDSLKNTKLYRIMRAEERAAIIEDVKNEDDTKLKMSAYLSSQTGKLKKTVMDSLVVVLIRMDKEKTNKQLEKEIRDLKDLVRRYHMLRS